MNQKTYNAKPEDIKPQWHLIDANGKTLGRMACEIANLLRGKHRPQYTPHVDCGDFVIVVQAEKVKLTGRKWDQKNYHYHTGYVGGLVSRTAQKMNEENPEKMIELAVKRMIPANSLGRKQMKKLKIYQGTEHPHSAQNPVVKNTQEPLKHV